MTTPLSKSGIYQIPCTEIPIGGFKNLGKTSSKDLQTSSKDLQTSSKDPKKLSAIFQKKNIWKSSGEITITFGSSYCSNGCGCDPAPQSWSLIGTDAKLESPSMNLCFLDPPYDDFTFNNKRYSKDQYSSAIRNYCSDSSTDESECTSGWVPGATVIHEFGHALGMLHEHQNDLLRSNPIKLNIPVVKKYYRDNHMTDADAIVNSIDRYFDQTLYEGSTYDPESIMLYFIPDDWILGYGTPSFKNPTKPNFKLSSTDKVWLSREYPSSSKAPHISVRFIDKREPEWKQAWVQKMVMEHIQPLVNIVFTFVPSIGPAVTIRPFETPRPAPSTAVVPYMTLKPSEVNVITQEPSTNKWFDWFYKLFSKEKFNANLETDSFVYNAVLITLILLILWVLMRK